METILSNYPSVFVDSKGKFDGELHLYTKQDVTSHKRAPREISLSMKDNFIAEEKNFQEQGIREKVIENKPSSKNGIRLCIDSRPLNIALNRSKYPFPTVDHLLTEIGNVKQS